MILDMHAGMIRHRVDGGQASASAIRTMALGGRQLKLGYTNPTDPWIYAETVSKWCRNGEL